LGESELAGTGNGDRGRSAVAMGRPDQRNAAGALAQDIFFSALPGAADLEQLPCRNAFLRRVARSYVHRPAAAKNHDAGHGGGPGSDRSDRDFCALKANGVHVAIDRNPALQGAAASGHFGIAALTLATNHGCHPGAPVVREWLWHESLGQPDYESADHL